MTPPLIRMLSPLRTPPLTCKPLPTKVALLGGSSPGEPLGKAPFVLGGGSPVGDPLGKAPFTLGGSSVGEPLGKAPLVLGGSSVGEPLGKAPSVGGSSPGEPLGKAPRAYVLPPSALTPSAVMPQPDPT